MTEPIDIPGPDHRAEPTGAAAPNKAAWRTALQVGPAAALALLGFLPGLLQGILDGFGRQLPAEIYGLLATVTGGVTLTAAIAAYVMAQPKAVEWFKTYLPFFAPQKK